MPGKYIATPIKEAIVRAKAEGQTDRAVASLFGVGQKTVNRVYTRHVEEGFSLKLSVILYEKFLGSVKRKSKSGRPRITSEWQDRALCRVVRADPKKTATDVASYARHNFHLIFTNRTARNILKRAKLFARRPASKPSLMQRHRQARLEFARGHKDWSVEDWAKVIWSDETRFNMYTPDGCGWVRRPLGKRYDQRYIKGTVKYGAGSLMAWGNVKKFFEYVIKNSGCFTRDCKGPLVRINGIMNAPMYRDILAEYLLPFARDRIGENFIFQQDGDSKHMSQMMTGHRRKLPDGRRVVIGGWFRENRVPLMKWPALSPDLNPIESLWAIVKRKLRGNRFRTKDELWEAVKEAWGAIPLDNLISLIDSMPRRIQSVIRAKGGPTEY